MMLHSNECRQFHRTWISENTSSGLRDTHFTKSRPTATTSDKSCAPGQAQVEQMVQQMDQDVAQLEV